MCVDCVVRPPRVDHIIINIYYITNISPARRIPTRAWRRSVSGSAELYVLSEFPTRNRRTPRAGKPLALLPPNASIASVSPHVVYTDAWGTTLQDDVTAATKSYADAPLPDTVSLAESVFSAWSLVPAG